MTPAAASESPGVPGLEPHAVTDPFPNHGRQQEGALSRCRDPLSVPGARRWTRPGSPEARRF